MSEALHLRRRGAARGAAWVAAAALAATAPATSHAQSGRYDVLVSSQDTHSVKRFDGETGAYLGDFVESSSGGLAQTQEVLFSREGDLLVTGFGTSAVLKYDARSGDFLGPFTSGYGLSQPTKTNYGPDGHLYVSQWSGRETVVRFDGITGVFIDEVTPQLQDPMQQAWDADGTLYVVSFASTDVRRFDAAGQLIDVFASEALTGPVNLWFDPAGYLAVLDWRAGELKRYDAESGAIVDVFVTGLARAEGWDYGPDGNLYVADWANHRVNAYDPESGAFIRTFLSGGGLQTPNSVLFFERQPDFGIAASRASIEVRPGQHGELSVTLMPDRDLAYDSPVMLACASLPSDVRCAFSPASVVPGEDGASATLTVSMATSAGIDGLPFGSWAGPGAGFAWLALAGWAAAGLLATHRRGARRRLRPALGSALLAAALAGGCGGGDDPVEPEVEQPRTVRFSVLASSDALVRSTDVTLTIHPK